MIYKPTFTISDTQMEKITDYLKYQTVLPDLEDETKTIPNPQARPSFLLEKVKDYLKNCYFAEKSKDGETARLLALEEGETELETLNISS